MFDKFALQPVDVITVIITVLNEEANISQVLQSVTAQAKDSSTIKKVVVVDGGSQDNTLKLAKQFSSRSKVPIRIVSSPERGRALQFNWGVKYAVSSGVFLFLHGDTVLPRHFDVAIRHVTIFYIFDEAYKLQRYFIETQHCCRCFLFGFSK